MIVMSSCQHGSGRDLFLCDSTFEGNRLRVRAQRHYSSDAQMANHGLRLVRHPMTSEKLFPYSIFVWFELGDGSAVCR